ncbi:MAG: hypothetical protein DDT26_00801 [Dehalococcoidia bacterium]|nr:hypothetical protein [Chloroflexota bacterium]
MKVIKIIVLMGPPGAGKTTLMKRFIAETGPYELDDSSIKLVPFLRRGQTFILGKYDGDTYAQGTDRMSMACQPAVVDWLKTLPPTSNVLLEGDRLANQSFLESCINSAYNLKVIYLEASPELRASRRSDRGSDQSEQFLRGRDTKYATLLTNFGLMDSIEVTPNVNESDLTTTVARMIDLL